MSATGELAVPPYPANRWLIAAVVGVAAFMEILDIAIANVSLPHIAGSLSASQDESTWILTAYLVSNAIVQPISGWFAQLVGRRRLFLASIACFTIASLLCGIAPSLGWLVAFRVFQGAAGGGLQPLSQSILADSFPPAERAMAFATYGAAVVFAPAVGPVLGGWITDNFSWHWIFLLNVPVGALLIGIAATLVHDSPFYTATRKARLASGFRIDVVGIGLLAIGLGCLQIMLDRGQENGWFASDFILTLGVLAAGGLIVLVLWEPFQRYPIVDLTLFKNANFSIANLMMFVVGFVLYGSTLLIPQFVQQIFGYTATLAGLVLSPGGFVVVVTMPVVGFLSARVDTRWLVAAGLLPVALSMFYLSGIDLNTSFNQLMLTRIIQDLGLAFILIPITSIAYVGVPADKTDQVSSLVNLARNIGGSVGISLVTSWLARRGQYHHAVLAEHITPYSTQYQSLLHTMTQHFMHLGASLSAARDQAQAAVAGMLGRQAQLLSYIDDYWILGAIIAGLIPLTLLIAGGKHNEAYGGGS
jgi:DHA2 family multidrug resistance protein